MYTLSAFLTKFPCLYIKKVKISFTAITSSKLKSYNLTCIVWGCCWPHCHPKWLELNWNPNTPSRACYQLRKSAFFVSGMNQICLFMWGSECPTHHKYPEISKKSANTQNQPIRATEKNNGPITDLETVNSLFSSRCWCLLLSPIVT